MRVFLDTNVWASGLATRGLCSDVVRTVIESHELVICERLLVELGRVLRSKFGAPVDAAEEAVQLLRDDSILGDETPLVKVSLKDKDDVPILSAAINAGAEVFVTGDAQIQRLGRLGSMRIVSPRRFWEELRGPATD